MRRLLLAALLLAAAPAGAEEVTISHQGRSLVGNLEAPEFGKPEDGVLLMVHDTMGDKASPMIVTQQKLLAAQGITTLAINLSLGLDGRRAPLTCDQPQRHLQSDADEELVAWRAWIKERGSAWVAFWGHGRGANQVARYSIDKRPEEMRGFVLVAPMTWRRGQDQIYEARFGEDLGKTLRQARGLVRDDKGDQMLTAGFLTCPKAQVSAAAFSDYYSPNARFSTLDLLPKLKAPALVVAGTKDEQEPTLVREMYKMEGGQYTFVPAEGVGHEFLGEDAERLAEITARFLRNEPLR